MVFKSHIRQPMLLIYDYGIIRASFRNFVKGGQKLSIENLWGGNNIPTYKNSKGGEILQSPPSLPNEALGTMNAWEGIIVMLSNVKMLI